VALGLATAAGALPAAAATRRGRSRRHRWKWAAVRTASAGSVPTKDSSNHKEVGDHQTQFARVGVEAQVLRTERVAHVQVQIHPLAVTQAGGTETNLLEKDIGIRDGDDDAALADGERQDGGFGKLL